MTHPLLEVRSLAFSYPGRLVLQEVSLRIDRPGFYGIIGPNGGGKTTFFQLLLGFLHPQQGTIHMEGKTPHEYSLQMGYVPQIHPIDKDFPITLLDMVLLGALGRAKAWGRYPQELRDKAIDLLERLHLASVLHHPFTKLSGGMAKRALFARALLNDPKILLLDESLANIDPPSTQILLQELAQRKKKTLIFLVTHDLPTVLETVDHVLCLNTTLSSHLPSQVCEHFALGLYHTPIVPKKDPWNFSP